MLGRTHAPIALSSVFDLQDSMSRCLATHLGRADGYRRDFQRATPFPHLVIDNFLPVDLAEALVQTFPGPDSPVWTKLPTEDQRRKLATRDEGLIPPLQRYVLLTLNSGSFLSFFEQATGIDALVADTKLVGGGLHQITRGGRLSVHIDYSHHPQTRLFRRLNALLYLNPDWREDYGGHLELWNATITKCEARILPVFNRLALFATSEISYHGHPDPIAAPEGLPRRSLSLYYFTKEPPAEKEGVEHNTLFKSRPGDPFSVGSTLVRIASSGLVRDLLPPIVYRGIRGAWNRRFAGK